LNWLFQSLRTQSKQKEVGQKNELIFLSYIFLFNQIVGLRWNLASALLQLDFGVATLAKAWGSPLVLPGSGERGYGTTPLLCFDKALALLVLGQRSPLTRGDPWVSRFLISEQA
jgi:hypothetical protein